MRLGKLSLLLVALLLWLWQTPVGAETRRVAVVVGSNAGQQGHPALRFAENDAGKMARVMVELGGVAERDLLLLQGRSLAEVRNAIEDVRARVKDWRGQADTRVLFLFYFSGHSDGISLEIGTEPLRYEQLRGWISSLGADVRIIMVDSCKSGSLVQTKGGTRQKATFEIHLDDDLPKSGEVVITSSAVDEGALESAELRGSFFTHHLVSGLRGAADVSGDGQVSLAEVYKYAFTHTVSATANTLAGTQRPVFDYRLSGQGELILTELRARSASLTVPQGFKRVLVTEILRDQVVAELTAAARTKLALQPGPYSVRAWKDERELVAQVRLAEREDRVLRPEDMKERAGTSTVLKGGAAIADHPSTSAGSLRRAGWILGGAGLAALGTGALFRLHATSLDEASRRDGHCDAATGCDVEGLALNRDALQANRVANVLFIASGVLVASGAALFVIVSSKGRATPPSFGPSATVTDGGAGVAVRGVF